MLNISLDWKDFGKLHIKTEMAKRRLTLEHVEKNTKNKFELQLETL